MLVAVAGCSSGGQVSGPEAGTAGGPGRALAEGRILAADVANRLLVLDRRGTVVRMLPDLTGGRRIQAIDLTPDRNTAYVALLRRPGEDSETVAGPAPALETIYELRLPAGPAKEIGRGVSPTLSPDGSALAYWRGEIRDGITYRTALVVRRLSDGEERVHPVGASAVVGTGPELIISWSPSGDRIAAVGARLIHVVDLDEKTTVVQSPTVPGEGPSLARQHLLAPAFRDDERLVALADCCTGPQHLVEVHLPTGDRRPFATVVGPPESMRRTESGRLLVATAALRLLSIDNDGHVRELRRGIVAADG